MLTTTNREGYCSIHAEKGNDGTTGYRVTCFRCGTVTFTKKVVDALKAGRKHFC